MKTCLDISPTRRARPPGGRATRGAPFAIAVLAWITIAAPALAQGVARSMDIDGSVRSSGMGGASGAAFWGGDGNLWANPALLGYHEGIHYLWNRTQLVPGLADDVIFSSNRVTVGWGGLGLALGSLNLNYGESVQTDDTGNPIGTFDSSEDIDMVAAAVSVSQLAAVLDGDGDGAGPFDFADVAAGFTRKHVTMSLGPFFPRSASATTHDWGALVRVSPMPRARASETGGVFLDVAYGYSVLNYDDVFFVFLNEDIAYPPSRFHRNAVAARVGVQSTGASDPDNPWGRGFEPLVSLGFTMDQEHITAGSFEGGYDVDRWGVEAMMFNALAIRVGHVTDRLGDIDGTTFGLGAGVPFGEFGGVRYDFASIPQADGLESVKRHAITAWVDPFRMAAAARGRGGWASTSAPSGADSRSGSRAAARRP